jgi:hypothetical protein
MRTRSHFLSLYACLLVVIVSCTSHQRPVAQAGAHPAAPGAGAAVSTGLPAAFVDHGFVGKNTAASHQSAAGTQVRTEANAGGPVTFYAVKMVETAPVSSLPSSTAEADKTQSQPGIEANELNDVHVKQNMPGPGPGPTASSARTSSIQAVTATSPTYLFDFEGNSAASNTAFFGGTVAPPDTEGAVGPNHYVQYVNLLVGVYDKTTHALIGGRFALSSFFAPLGGICAATDDGDPIVLYDKLSNRWILSQFGFAGLNTPPYHQCIGISKTPDPTGPYYAYDFQLPGQEFPDYPKFGTWPDAYYMTTNQFFQGGNFDGAGAFAFDRAKMLVGDPTATGIYFNLCFTTGHCSPTHPEGIFGMLPSDFDGLAVPPAGIPNPFLYPTATLFGDPTDGLRIFYFSVGSPFGTSPTFAERAGSSYTSPEVPIGAYDPRIPGGRAHIRQPSPAAISDSLDSVGERMMYRMQYMNFAGTEKLVTNITVNLSGVNPTSSSNFRAAVHYFDLQRTSPGGAFAVNDEGTYAPTTDGRWMGSAAADNSADVAVGYSISSTTVHPSLRFAGRLPGDPAGTLGPEQSLFAGVGVQRQTSNRWGDYSALQLDPTDFCTFWYTNEYYTTTNMTFNWQTRIGGFKFPTCVSPAMGTLAGNVTYCQTGNPISGAVIQVSDGHGGATSVSGNYSIALAPGTYTVTATDPAINCATSSAQTVTITNGATTPANFCLTGTPLIDLTADSFDDSAGNNNGIINRDECFKVNTVLKNDGCLGENGISAVLSTSTAGVVVDQPFSTYPNLAINASGGNDTPYRAHTTPGFVCGTPIVFSLAETGSFGGSRTFSFSFPTCSGGAAQPFSGTLTDTDSIASNGRLGRAAHNSPCGSPNGCPGTIGSGPKFYDTFSFANTSAVTECLTINLDQSNCVNALIDGAYLDSFDGTNLCTNYLGDAGASPAHSSFQVAVPAGHNLIVSVQQVTTGVFCPSPGYSGTVTGFIDNTDAGSSKLTALSPADVWIGLKNSDDVGTNFDLKAEVFRNGTLIGSGETDNVSGGSSGFNNAKDRAIALALSSTTDPICSGDTLSIRLSVRVTLVGGHTSGTARLWYNDSAADSHFDATIGGVNSNFYLLNGFVLGTSPGTGPKLTIDVFVSRTGGNPFKPFGTWIKTF